MTKEGSQLVHDEIIANVQDLPIKEKVIHYLHTAIGFPTKATLIKAIKKGFYATWPMLTVASVNKHFPESEETQKGHMRQTPRQIGR